MNDARRWLRAEWDRVAGYACLVAGVVVLIFGILGVRDAADVIDEIAYLTSGGIGAMFLLGVGSVLLLSADLHDDFRKLHRVEENQLRLEEKLDRVERLLAAEHPELAGPDPLGPGPGPGAPAEETIDVTARAPAGTGAVRQGRILAAVAVVVAGSLFGAGWWRTARAADTDHLAGSVGLALGGALLVAGVAAVMVSQLRDQLERRKLAVLGLWMAEPAVTALLDASAEPAGRVWVVDGLRLYHRRGCLALEGRAASETERSGLGAGYGPCSHCGPG